MSENVSKKILSRGIHEICSLFNRLSVKRIVFSCSGVTQATVKIDAREEYCCNPLPNLLFIEDKLYGNKKLAETIKEVFSNHQENPPLSFTVHADLPWP